jgi:3-phosphoshikimate 1-carboxyvinyltransferase
MAGVRSITPAIGPLDAVVEVPGSKSIANRALVCAALANGASTLRGVAPGDDTAAMIDCLAALGIEVGIQDGTAHVAGTGGRLRSGPVHLHARLAGTTSRFVTALAALAEGPVTIDGEPPLRRRPMAPLHDALVVLGADVTWGEGTGHLPVTIGRGTTNHGRNGAVVSMPGDVSSQYVTALMLIAPLLSGGLSIALTSDLVSRPYVEITAAVMASFGATDIEVGERLVRVRPGSYSPTDLRIEPDASSASYPLAAAAICGGRVRVDGLGADALQGDAAFADVLEAMGCNVERTSTFTRVGRDDVPLTGVEVDMADMSDLVPTLAVVAGFATTPTRITGVGFIRHKESDRIGDLIAELAAVGIAADEEPDGLVVHPSTPHGGRVRTHHDHRMAMALSLVGLRVAGVEIEDPDVVTKSWPQWWQSLDGLHR